MIIDGFKDKWEARWEAAQSMQREAYKAGAQPVSKRHSMTCTCSWRVISVVHLQPHTFCACIPPYSADIYLRLITVLLETEQKWSSIEFIDRGFLMCGTE